MWEVRGGMWEVRRRGVEGRRMEEVQMREKVDVNKFEKLKYLIRNFDQAER
jgi:hypothetical protein